MMPVAVESWCHKSHTLSRQQGHLRVCTEPGASSHRALAGPGLPESRVMPMPPARQEKRYGYSVLSSIHW